MDRKPPMAKPPKVSSGAGMIDLTISGTGSGVQAAGKENFNAPLPRPLGSGIRSLSQSKNQSANQALGGRQKTSVSLSNNSRTPRASQAASISSSSLQLQNNGKRIISQTRGKQEEEKKNPALPTGYTNKPSDRFMKIKTADPFGQSTKKHKTNFGYVYAAGGIPCRINHGTVNHKISWDSNPASLDYDPLLVNCFEGLLETDHPYSFVAFQALKELLEAPGAAEKTVPIIGKLIMPLRMALMQGDEGLWARGLNALKLLAETVGHNLNQHIHILLAQLNKKLTLNKKVRETVMSVLQVIEERGGKEAFEVIRSKIPTYTSIYM